MKNTATNYRIARRLIEGALGSNDWYVAIPTEGERVILGTTKDDAAYKMRRMRRDGSTFTDNFGYFSSLRYRGIATGGDNA